VWGGSVVGGGVGGVWGGEEFGVSGGGPIVYLGGRERGAVKGVGCCWGGGGGGESLLTVLDPSNGHMPPK